MALPSGIGQAFVRWSVTGDNEVMVSTFHYDASANLGTPNTSATSIKNRFNTFHAAADINGGYTFLGVRVLQGIGGGLEEQGTADQAVVGTFGSSPLPNNCALLIHKRTALPGRKGQGRMYYPPAPFVNEANIDAVGTVAGASVTAINTKLVTLLAGLVTDNTDMLVVDAAGVSAGAVTVLTLDPRIATQRRRLRK